MEYLLKRISNLNHVGIIQYDRLKQTQIYFEEYTEFNPMMNSEFLKSKLINGSLQQEQPYIYKDEFGVYYSSIRKGATVYMVGPMSITQLDYVDTHQYYRFYKMQTDIEKKLVHFTFAEILDIVEILAKIIMEKEYKDDELIYVNKLITGTKKQEKEEQVLYDLKEVEEDFYHHTYQEERKLLDCIRDGRSEDALRYSRNMDSEIGKLSGKELNHWKNLAIVAIALCTRAAIDGGISPSIAYRLSDFYIQKCDVCNDIAQVIKFRDHAVEELTNQVKKRLERRSSSYVERCKDYINKHYKKKIYLSEIAASLGISETYLSRLFKKETGIRMQDFIIDVRLEHAGNLLKYSNEEISNIAEYVNFPSQSYMGKIFKAKYGMTPKQYREKNRPSEFFEG